MIEGAVITSGDKVVILGSNYLVQIMIWTKTMKEDVFEDT